MSGEIERTAAGSIPERMLRALEAIVVLLGRQASRPPDAAEPRQQEYAHTATVTEIAGWNERRRKLFVQNKGSAAIVLGTSSLTPRRGIRIEAGEFFSDDTRPWPGPWYFRASADVVVVGDEILVREETE